jgi:hypothetical protein
MSKVLHYAIDDTKICQDFSKVNLKVIWTSLQKLITCGLKNWRKGGKNGKILVSFQGYQWGCSKL